MDEHDDDRAEDRSSEPVTERVRIVGAEQAGVLAGEQTPEGVDESPTGREHHYLGFIHHAEAPPPPPPPPPPPAGDGATLAAVPPEMPHWADPPTGQVPAVIDRRSDESEDDAGWSAFSDSGPVWREHEHEWEDSGGYEPAMLADDQTRVGALDETPVEERRPWEFDDLTPAAPADREPPGDAWEGPGSTLAGADLADAEVVTAEHDIVPGGSTSAPAGTEAGSAAWTGQSGQADAGAGLTPGTATTAVAASTGTEPASGASSTPSLHAGAPTTGFTTNGDPATLPPSAAEASSSPESSAQTLASTPPVVAARERRRRHVSGRAAAPEEAPSRRNIPVAIATGVAFAAIGLGCFAAGPLATLVLATVVVALAAAEIYASLRRAGMRPATLLGLVATVAVMVTAYSKGVAALPLVTILVVITSMLWYLVGAERTSPVEGVTSTILSFAWVGLMGSFAGLILAPSIYPHRHGVAFIAGAVVATVGSDVGALVAGSLVGRHQLAPHVSPNKTWEGWFGGAIVAIGLSVGITGQMHPWTPGKAAVLGAVVAVVAPIGDLCESLIKRDLGLKDMGSLLPGHGGVLDRIDGLLFVLPATYYLVRVLNLG